MQRDYYTVEYGSGARDPETEAVLAAAESDTLSVLGKIDARVEFTAQDKYQLAFFVALLFSRVPDFEKSYNKMREKTAQDLLSDRFPNPEAVTAWLAAHPDVARDLPSINPEHLVDFLQSRRYTVKIPRAYSIVAMLETAMQLTEFLRHLEWRFYYAPRDLSFVTSDAPFNLLPPPDHGEGPVWTTTPGTQKIVPLGERVCLVMFDPGTHVTYATASAEDVTFLNTIIAEGSDRFVFSADEVLLRDVVKIAEVEYPRTDGRFTLE